MVNKYIIQRLHLLKNHNAICSTKIPTGDDVLIIPDFLNNQEIQELKSLCSNSNYTNSKVVINGNITNENTRKSMSCFIEDSESIIVSKIKNTVSSLLPTNKRIEIQVLKYEPDGFYKPHHDDFDDIQFEDNRKFTFFVILENECEGGETEFPNLNKTFKPEKGSAIFWNSFNSDKTRNSNKLHGGKKVISGQKMACNIWIR